MRKLLPLLFAFTLPAQTEPPPAAALTPVLQIEALGPAAWRQQLLPTNIGSVIASEAGEGLWQGLLAALDAQWDALHGDAATFAASRRRLLDYSGAMHLQLWIGVDGEPAAITLVADADGRTDLAAVTEDLRHLVGNATGGSWAKQDFGGTQRLALDLPGSCCTLEAVPGGGAVLAAGDNPTAVAQALALALAQPSAPRRVGAALFDLRLDLAEVVRRNSTADNEAKVMAALGMNSLRTLQFTLRPSGPQVQFEVALQCEGERGLYAGLFPERAGVPDLLGYAPSDAIAVKTSRFDAMALWRMTLDAIAAEGTQTVAELEATARRELGIDLAKDLLPHLLGEAMLVWEAPVLPTGDGEEAAMAREQAMHEPLLDLVVRLGDGKAFATAFATFLDKVGLNPTTEDGVLRAGEDQQWFIPALHFGVQGDIAVMALGGRGAERVDAILARHKAPTPPPKVLAQRQSAMPAGGNGVGLVAVDAFLGLYLPALFEVLHEMVPGNVVPRGVPEQLTPLMQQFLPLLQKQQLDKVVMFTGTDKGRWCLRILW